MAANLVRSCFASGRNIGPLPNLFIGCISLNWPDSAGASILAFGLSLGAVRILVPWLVLLGALDVPNERSSHETPVPRGGGLGIIIGVVGGAIVLWFAGVQMPPWPVIGAFMAVVLLGAAEDVGMDLSQGVRLAVQVIAACAVVSALGPLERFPAPAPLDVPLGVMGWPLTVLWIVGVTNFFNFMDGIDGYAGFQGFVAGAALTFVGFGWVAGLGLVVAAACAGFLVFNWNPAQVFMGDVGSLPLGFLFAVLPLGLGPKASFGVFVMGLALWFFLADGTFTIVRRLMSREKIWQAHRSHLYQRLTVAGWAHSRIVLVVAGGMVLVATAAVISVTKDSTWVQWATLTMACVLFLGYWWMVVRVEGRPKAINELE